MGQKSLPSRLFPPPPTRFDSLDVNVMPGAPVSILYHEDKFQTLKIRAIVYRNGVVTRGSPVLDGFSSCHTGLRASEHHLRL